MDTFLQRPNRFGGRNLGTLTSAGLNRPGNYPLGFTNGLSNAQPRLQQTPDMGSSWGPSNGRGGMNLGTLTSADLVRGGPNYNTYPGNPQNGQRTTYDKFLAGNPDSPAATGSLAGPQPVRMTAPSPASMQFLNDGVDRGVTAPPFKPPQQTERANPLTGATGAQQMEGTSTAVARPPFVQRGSLPNGRDAIPSPIKETISEDDDIGRSMQGTFGRLRDSFNRNFSQPSASPASSLARAQLY